MPSALYPQLQEESREQMHSSGPLTSSVLCRPGSLDQGMAMPISKMSLPTAIITSKNPFKGFLEAHLPDDSRFWQVVR